MQNINNYILETMQEGMVEFESISGCGWSVVLSSSEMVLKQCFAWHSERGVEAYRAEPPVATPSSQTTSKKQKLKSASISTNKSNSMMGFPTKAKPGNY